jgi:hypothetical protein
MSSGLGVSFGTSHNLLVGQETLKGYAPLFVIRGSLEIAAGVAAVDVALLARLRSSSSFQQHTATDT